MNTQSDIDKMENSTEASICAALARFAEMPLCLTRTEKTVPPLVACLAPLAQEAEKPEAEKPDTWSLLKARAWTVEAMLCTAGPIDYPPAPEPADKEEFERLKKADPSFERNYYCGHAEGEREKAYEKARACEAARAKVYELAREDVGSDIMGEHLKSMIMDYGLGGTHEFEIGCAYSQQYNSMDEFALYMRVMPDFLDRHYDAGSYWARDQLIREAKALLEQQLPDEAAAMRRAAADDDLYA